MSIVTTVVNAILAPFRLLLAINLFIITNAVFIPISLVINIMVYTPLIKIPIVIPLRYFLELDKGNFDDFGWLAGQVELFFLTLFHFVMVSFYIGIIVGLITWMNLSAIRFVLTLPLKSTEQQEQQEAVHNKKPLSSGIDRHQLFDLVNPVIISDVDVARNTLRDKIEARRAKSDKITSETNPVTESVSSGITPHYEDDDGYNFPSGLRNRKTPATTSTFVQPRNSYLNRTQVDDDLEQQDEEIEVSENDLVEQEEEEENMHDSIGRELTNIPEETEDDELFTRPDESVTEETEDTFITQE
ncbi:hypothetical protein JA1_005263 [Spathaspora sp. JA1]|nr:hypothetical protein JA1_005263 [Spathaspora sp. JA1]